MSIFEQVMTIFCGALCYLIVVEVLSQSYGSEKKI